MRVIHFLAIGCFFLSGCTSKTNTETSVSTSTASNDSSSTTSDVSVQLNWYPEAEHGGIYQAFSDGTYDVSGFDVDIRPGGRATSVAPELELGRVQFAMANADDVVISRREGMDIVAVMAVMQNSPRCILVREDSGAKSFDQLGGMTLQREAGRLFLEFMRSKGILDQVKEVPYHGSISSLIADPQIAIQAYSFAEPLLAKQQGVPVRTLMVSDLGWNPYSSVLITTGKLIREQPELVRRFVEATRKGWQNYLLDPSEGNAAIMDANQHGMTRESLTFGVKELTPLAMPMGTTIDQVGMMNEARWEKLVQQMNDLDAAEESSVKASDCFTLEFLR